MLESKQGLALRLSVLRRALGGRPSLSGWELLRILRNEQSIRRKPHLITMSRKAARQSQDAGDELEHLLCYLVFEAAFRFFILFKKGVFSVMKRTKKKNQSRVRCPYCGGSAVLRSADGIYRDNPNDTMLYVCSRYPRCDAYVRIQPGTTRPIGSLANRELRALRKEAHRHFDRLHSDGIMTKQEAYSWLAALLQAPLSEAHIGYLSEYSCNQVIRESRKLLERAPQKKRAHQPGKEAQTRNEAKREATTNRY